MLTKYAVRITEANLDLITVLNSGGRPMVQQEKTFFLFTVDSPNTTTDHDIVEENDLVIYDGNNETPRIHLQ